jgi:drug/metabolite transporter (DMT)-like permease
VVFFALIAEVGPTRATLITFVNPAVAIGLGVVVLDEPLTTGLVIGFPLVLAGCWLSSRHQAPAAPAEVPVGDRADDAPGEPLPELAQHPAAPS